MKFVISFIFTRIIDSKRKARKEPQMDPKVNDDVLTLCKKTDSLLWSSFESANNMTCHKTAMSHLVFPVYSEGSGSAIRISEQEARFAFVEAIVSSDYSFSAETPTRKLYQFSGESETSAQTDLSLYDNNFANILGIEFKSKGFSLNASDHSEITKDIQKLLREQCDGLWFHILESTSNTTITNLFKVFQSDMLDMYNEYKGDIDDKVIIFHICVLKHGFSVHKICEVNENSISLPSLNHFFQFDFHVSREELVNTGSNNGWNVNIKQVSS